MGFLAKTFGGLSKEYLFGQFFFGLFGYAILVILIGYQAYAIKGEILPLGISIGVGFVLWLLYPYSRFVYESMVGFIMGNNVFFTGIWYFVITKVMTMLLCYMFGFIIAPIGLAYLYFHHSKQEKIAQSEQQ